MFTVLFAIDSGSVCGWELNSLSVGDAYSSSSSFFSFLLFSSVFSVFLFDIDSTRGKQLFCLRPGVSLSFFFFFFFWKHNNEDMVYDK